MFAMKVTVMKTEMLYQINLVLGDWSDDGHGKTQTKTVRCNLTLEELEKAYIRGSEIVGFNLCDEVAVEYGDSTLEAPYVAMLKEHGCNFLPDDALEKDGSCCLYGELFANIFMFVCERGADPELAWEFSKENTNYHIGGYGLFN